MSEIELHGVENKSKKETVLIYFEIRLNTQL